LEDAINNPWAQPSAASALNCPAGLSAYVAGQGPPLLLVHSVNAAASAGRGAAAL
jgi:hypothetical protein